MPIKGSLGLVALGASLLATMVWLYLPEQAGEALAPLAQRAAPPASASESATGPVDAQPITPIPQTVALDPLKVALGRRLFHDRRLSHDDTVACASCHVLAIGGVDGRARPVGIGGREGALNAPTVYNAALNYRQFWDGRALTLETQADGPVHNPAEMGSSWPEVLGKLQRDADFARDFTLAYPEGLSAAALRDAIATFERALITPNAPFDHYLRGQQEAISPDARAGWQLFRDLGCVSCHQGVNVGGNLYEKLGLVEDYFGPRGRVSASDLGRYNLTGNVEHRFEFRVPPLRNVALTAPYLHDGSVATLEGAVLLMARYQLGLRLKPDEVRQLVAFLQSLTGMPTEAAGLGAAPPTAVP